MNNSLRSLSYSGLVLTALLIGSTASADESVDLDRGRELAYTCMGCHGISGFMNAYPAYHVPKLGGQNADYIVVALQAYAKGERDHPTMQAQGGSLSDEEMRDIAAYFESFAR